MNALKLSMDRKTSPYSTWAEGSGEWKPKVKNAFGLPAGWTCPGATDACLSVCYASFDQQWPGVRNLLQHNLDVLTGLTREEMVERLSEAVREFQAQARKYDVDEVFRIHWSGDYFSVDYYNAWADVAEAFPEVKFWAYTRSFAIVEAGREVPDNLSVYLSADRDNMHEARSCADRTGLRIAIMADTNEQTVEIGLGKAPICPVDNGRMEMVVDGEGACAKCKLCIRGKRDIVFPLRTQGKGGRKNTTFVR